MEIKDSSFEYVYFECVEDIQSWIKAKSGTLEKLCVAMLSPDGR